MITIKMTTHPWAINFGFTWQIENHFTERIAYFKNWDEVVDHISTLNY